MRRPGEVLSRYQLLEHVWDYDYENRSNVVDVYIRYLREKVDRPFGIKSIDTVRGVGYRMRKDGGILSRLALKLKLTLAFAGVMALVLIATGLFVYLRLGDELDDSDRRRRCVRAPTRSRRSSGSRARSFASRARGGSPSRRTASPRSWTRTGGWSTPRPGPAADRSSRAAEVARARMGTLVVSARLRSRGGGRRGPPARHAGAGTRP